MQTSILGLLSRLPSLGLEQMRILKLENLDVQRPTALDHLLLAVVTETPK
jgi:hypothetical protein